LGRNNLNNLYLTGKRRVVQEDDDMTLLLEDTLFFCIGSCAAAVKNEIGRSIKGFPSWMKFETRVSKNKQKKKKLNQQKTAS
jgi:hypothetical protein